MDFVFNKSVERQFEAFAEGFGRACPAQTWKIFHPDELRMLIFGEAEYEWEDLRKVKRHYTTPQLVTPGSEMICVVMISVY